MSADDKSLQARTRILEACVSSRHLADGRAILRFDPQPGAYDPTTDLDVLGVDYDVAVVKGTTVHQGRVHRDCVWFEARFWPPGPDVDGPL
ncbi:hypothetical protein GCM10023321_14310 [Pseudonocardia eucalypti]|uniref:Uncharacterized protein n=1 Tax=Pseudonocardia eucalypti TaxID=648755 RepID=A0ABP9PPJ7_9PSEU